MVQAAAKEAAGGKGGAPPPGPPTKVEGGAQSSRNTPRDGPAPAKPGSQESGRQQQAPRPGVRGAPTSQQPPPAATTSAGAHVPSTQRMTLFSHLPHPRCMTVSDVAARMCAASDVHPLVLRLGLDFASGRIVGADARCVAMMEQFKAVVQVWEGRGGAGGVG